MILIISLRLLTSSLPPPLLPFLPAGLFMKIIYFILWKYPSIYFLDFHFVSKHFFIHYSKVFTYDHSWYCKVLCLEYLSGSLPFLSYSMDFLWNFWVCFVSWTHSASGGTSSLLRDLWSLSNQKASWDDLLLELDWDLQRKLYQNAFLASCMFLLSVIKTIRSDGKNRHRVFVLPHQEEKNLLI